MNCVLRIALASSFFCGIQSCKTRDFNDKSAVKGFGGQRTRTFSEPVPASAGYSFHMCFDVKKGESRYPVVLKGFVGFPSFPAKTQIKSGKVKFAPVSDKYAEAGNDPFYEEDTTPQELFISGLREKEFIQAKLVIDERDEVPFQGAKYFPEFMLDFVMREKPSDGGKEMWIFEKAYIKYKKIESDGKVSKDGTSQIPFQPTPCNAEGKDLDDKDAPSFYFDK